LKSTSAWHTDAEKTKKGLFGREETGNQKSKTLAGEGGLKEKGWLQKYTTHKWGANSTCRF